MHYTFFFMANYSNKPCANCLAIFRNVTNRLNKTGRLEQENGGGGDLYKNRESLVKPGELTGLYSLSS